MLRRYWLVVAALGLTAWPGEADLVLSPETRIVFGDGTEMSTAPTPGGGENVPGHGGTGNSLSGADAFIGGGTNNTVSADRGTISGGGDVSGSFGNYVLDAWGTIGGGRDNRTGDGFGTNADRPYGTIGGGWGNRASGYAATIGGGRLNTASGSFSTVAGGISNLAAGHYSFVAGRRAKGNAQGSFTFTDSTDLDFGNSTTNSFAVRATGGVFFFTRVSGGTEVFQINGLGQGSFSDDLFVDGDVFASGTFVRPGTEASRTPQTPVDAKSVLEGVASLPIQEYVVADASTSSAQLGFSAEDFYNTFGLGDDPAKISLLHADSVAFASIQALHTMVEERDARIAALETSLAAVMDRLTALESGRLPR